MSACAACECGVRVAGVVRRSRGGVGLNPRIGHCERLTVTTWNCVSRVQSISLLSVMHSSLAVTFVAMASQRQRRTRHAAGEGAEARATAAATATASADRTFLVRQRQAEDSKSVVLAIVWLKGKPAASDGSQSKSQTDKAVQCKRRRESESERGSERRERSASVFGLAVLLLLGLSGGRDGITREEEEQRGSCTQHGRHDERLMQLQMNPHSASHDAH